ncbi:MAG: FIST C-terminal domain-containing protein [Bdellovibrionales bacterium]|nr:FIST C-terminal domain-containing protein [Bdellovibrionales bacterium]
MKFDQRSWSRNDKWSSAPAALRADLVFVFGDTGLLKDRDLMGELSGHYPGAFLFGCSTAGEILGERVSDETLAVTAIRFERSSIRTAAVEITPDCYDAGKRLAASLPHEGLRHVFVLSVGLGVNGSDLVKGLSDGLPTGVSITGGLAGDQDRFRETVVVAGSLVSSSLVAAVGLYGPHLRIGAASLGGWDPFGPERRVTKSKGNVLYELDGKSALELYKTYLGDHAKNLPGSALLFPLCLRFGQTDTGIVRTILGVDEKDQSMTFAGDVPEGSYGRFMKANFDRLIEGALGAAKTSSASIRDAGTEFALLISCVGRKLVLGQRTEEETEGVRAVLGNQAVMTGFYSYGEISPFTPGARCELHNQTMTVTTLSESDEGR